MCLISQSCPILCDPMNCSPLGSSVHGDSSGKNTGVDCHAFFKRIFPTQGMNPGLLHCRQILYYLSHQGSPKRLVVVFQSLSRVRFFATPWTVVHQAPLSMEFPRQECWSGLTFPSPGDLPDPGIEPGSPAFQAVSLPTELLGKPSDLWG